MKYSAFSGMNGRNGARLRALPCLILLFICSWRLGEALTPQAFVATRKVLTEELPEAVPCRALFWDVSGLGASTPSPLVWARTRFIRKERIVKDKVTKYGTFL